MHNCSKCILCAAMLHQIICVLWLPSKTISCHGLGIVLPNSVPSLGLSQTKCHLVSPCPFLSLPLPALGMELRVGGTKDKIMG